MTDRPSRDLPELPADDVDVGPAPELGAAAVDIELAGLPPPPRRARTLTVVLLAAAALLASAVLFALHADARYALVSDIPTDVGALDRLELRSDLADKFVRGTGRIDATRAIRFARPFEADEFMLAPITGHAEVLSEVPNHAEVPSEVPNKDAPNGAAGDGARLPIDARASAHDGARLWVELRVPKEPDDAGGRAAAPATSFVGRLSRFSDGWLRYRGLSSVAVRAGAERPGSRDWVLVDGEVPRSTAWALPLSILFALFAAYGALSIARILRPVSRASASSPQPRRSPVP